MFTATYYSTLTKIRDGLWIDLSNIIEFREIETHYESPHVYVISYRNITSQQMFSAEDGLLIEAALHKNGIEDE